MKKFIKNLYLDSFFKVYEFIMNKTFIGKLYMKKYYDKNLDWIDNFDEWLESDSI